MFCFHTKVAKINSLIKIKYYNLQAYATILHPEHGCFPHKYRSIQQLKTLMKE